MSTHNICYNGEIKSFFVYFSYLVLCLSKKSQKKYVCKCVVSIFHIFVQRICKCDRNSNRIRNG